MIFVGCVQCWRPEVLVPNLADRAGHDQHADGRSSDPRSPMPASSAARLPCPAPWQAFVWLAATRLRDSQWSRSRMPQLGMPAPFHDRERPRHGRGSRPALRSGVRAFSNVLASVGYDLVSVYDESGETEYVYGSVALRQHRRAPRASRSSPSASAAHRPSPPALACLSPHRRYQPLTLRTRLAQNASREVACVSLFLKGAERSGQLPSRSINSSA